MGHVKALVGDITPGNERDLERGRRSEDWNLDLFRDDEAGPRAADASDGASALVQLSNEAWFGPTSAPRQMLTTAIFRAVENNIDLIRATNSGVSARDRSLRDRQRRDADVRDRNANVEDQDGG